MAHVDRPVVRSFKVPHRAACASWVRSGGHAIFWEGPRKAKLIVPAIDPNDESDLAQFSLLDLGLQDDEPETRGTFRGLIVAKVPQDCLGIVQRRIDFVEHADRRGIGEEHGEDQRRRCQRLLAAAHQRERGEALARRLREDFEAGGERILAALLVRLDQLQLGHAAFEERREERGEMFVHDVERGQQTLAAFRVQRIDPAPQFCNGGGDVGALCLQRFEPRLRFPQFGFGA